MNNVFSPGVLDTAGFLFPDISPSNSPNAGQGQSEAFSSHQGVVRLAEISVMHTAGRNPSDCTLPLASVGTVTFGYCPGCRCFHYVSPTTTPPPEHVANNLGGGATLRCPICFALLKPYQMPVDVLGRRMRLVWWCPECPELGGGV